MKAGDSRARIESHPLNREEALEQFRKNLLFWGNLNFQMFPWRKTNDPYAILMVEIMLHRTQVKQVVFTYVAFLEKYPEIKRIYEADEDSIRRSLEALGLHWRIGLIKQMAGDICNRFGAVIPQEKDLLVSLPGVSDYIASAVRCFAWNYPDPVIDTNTIRIIGRLYGLETKDSSRRNQLFRSLIQKLVDPQQPARFNYALLDLAHLVCHKKIDPECNACPVRIYCIYGQNRKTEMEK